MNTLVMRYSRQIYRSWFKSSDPPIPPGVTKFSYSACISCINLKLCDTELDFLLIKVPTRCYVEALRHFSLLLFCFLDRLADLKFTFYLKPTKGLY